MKTFSLESTLNRLVDRAGLFVASLIRTLGTVEQITRPMGHDDFDESVAEEFLGQHQPEICRAHQLDICASCDEGNDALWVHPRDFDDEDDETNRCYFCGDPTENLVNADDDPEFVCEDCCDETPNPTEPSLSDDELVGVRGLLQERYESVQSLNEDSLQVLKDARWPHGKRYDGWPAAEAARLKTHRAASTAGDSAGEASGHSPVPPSPARSGDDLSLLCRNASAGIDRWLEGSLCVNVEYWESVRDRLLANAIELNQI